MLVATWVVTSCAGCGEGTTEVTYLNLGPRALIEGSVVDGEGRPVAGAMVELTQLWRNAVGGEVVSVGDCSGVSTPAYTVTTDENGEFVEEMGFMRGSFDGCVAITASRGETTEPATVTIPLHLEHGERDTVSVTVVVTGGPKP